MEKLNQIAAVMQTEIESLAANYPTGACYLFGHCLAEVYKTLGFESRSVTGRCSYLLKGSGNKVKYVHYGRSSEKGECIGDYHTWCEVIVEARKYIVDASIKYNKRLLKANGMKLANSIPDLIVTGDVKCSSYAYSEDQKLNELSEKYLAAIPQESIEEIISKVKKKLLP